MVKKINYKLLFLLAVLLTCCTVSKDNRALTRIISNPVLADKAYGILVQQHPIKIDTIIKVIEGKEVIRYDTTELPVYYTDTVINGSPIKVKYKNTYLTKYITRLDTVLKVVQDDRLLNAAQTRVTVLETQLQASQNNDQQHIKGKRNWIFAAIGLGVLLLLGIILVFNKRI